MNTLTQQLKKSLLVKGAIIRGKMTGNKYEIVRFVEGTMVLFSYDDGRQVYSTLNIKNWDIIDEQLN